MFIVGQGSNGEGVGEMRDHSTSNMSMYGTNRLSPSYSGASNFVGAARRLDHSKDTSQIFNTASNRITTDESERTFMFDKSRASGLNESQDSSRRSIEPNGLSIDE